MENIAAKTGRDSTEIHNILIDGDIKFQFIIALVQEKM